MSRLKTLREYVDKELSLLADDKRISATAHLYGVSLAATILAKKRGLNEEIAAIKAAFLIYLLTIKKLLNILAFIEID